MVSSIVKNTFKVSLILVTDIRSNEGISYEMTASKKFECEFIEILTPNMAQIVKTRKLGSRHKSPLCWVACCKLATILLSIHLLDAIGQQKGDPYYILECSGGQLI